MKQIGSAEKIDFSYSGFIGNTPAIHRLIWMAREEDGLDLQYRVVEYVFMTYFKEENIMGKLYMMKECAELAGMDTSSVLQNRTDC